MNINLARDTSHFLMPHSLMYVGADRGTPDVANRALPESERDGLFAGLGSQIGALAGWLVDLPARRAAVAEMMAMSDRELADIGLSRCDIQAVVTRDFAARRRAA